MPVDANYLIALMNVFKNSTPSSPQWYQITDQVVGTLLAIEIERTENAGMAHPYRPSEKS